MVSPGLPGRSLRYEGIEVRCSVGILSLYQIGQLWLKHPCSQVQGRWVVAGVTLGCGDLCPSGHQIPLYACASERGHRLGQRFPPLGPSF